MYLLPNTFEIWGLESLWTYLGGGFNQSIQTFAVEICLKITTLYNKKKKKKRKRLRNDIKRFSEQMEEKIEIWTEPATYYSL